MGDERSTSRRGRDPGRASIWAAIHPRLLELVREHRSTLIFVNSRRLAERLAAALNELAGETLVARASRLDRARAAARDRGAAEGGDACAALVATSSLELGIDMGAVDLVIQIEAPPSVASGMQRIGRAGHSGRRGERGVIFPKYRGDLVACAAVARRDARGRGRGDPLSAQSARRARAADRRHGRDGRWDVDELFATRAARRARSPR